MSESVVASIAGIAAREVAGVAALHGGTRTGAGVGVGVGAGVDQRGRVTSPAAPGVIAMVGETEVIIDLSFIAEYGTDLVGFAGKVRAAVMSAVAHMTTLQVRKVNVTVADVQAPAGDLEKSGQSH